MRIFECNWINHAAKGGQLTVSVDMSAPSILHLVAVELCINLLTTSSGADECGEQNKENKLPWRRKVRGSQCAAAERTRSMPGRGKSKVRSTTTCDIVQYWKWIAAIVGIVFVTVLWTRLNEKPHKFFRVFRFRFSVATRVVRRKHVDASSAAIQVECETQLHTWLQSHPNSNCQWRWVCETLCVNCVLAVRRVVVAASSYSDAVATVTTRSTRWMIPQDKCHRHSLRHRLPSSRCRFGVHFRRKYDMIRAWPAFRWRTKGYTVSECGNCKRFRWGIDGNCRYLSRLRNLRAPL